MVGQWKKQVIQVFLVTVFLTYYGGATLFPHTHTYTWGRVTHSHPYLPSSHHSHAASALQLIDTLTQLVFVAGTVVFLAAPVAGFYRLPSVRCEGIVCRAAIHCRFRAPPVVC